MPAMGSLGNGSGAPYETAPTTECKRELPARPAITAGLIHSLKIFYQFSRRPVCTKIYENFAQKTTLLHLRIERCRFFSRYSHALNIIKMQSAALPKF